jgi:hypothetical protein
MVVNYVCDRDAKLSIVDGKYPGLARALRVYFGESLANAVRYDAAVLPVMQDANADLSAAMQPIKAAFVSEAREAVMADAAISERQRQDVANLLSGMADVVVTVAGTVSDIRTIQYCSKHAC